jgi:UDP-N-acetylmuramyl pentapeptide synthase
MSFFQNIGQKQRLAFNNHIGVPLTLLSFTAETEIRIVEMGLIIK